MTDKKKSLEEEIFSHVPEELLPSKDEWAKADEKFSVYVLTQGVSAEKVPFWAYLAIPPSKYLAYKNAEMNEGMTLSDYGEVIAMGMGYDPPEDIMRQMEEEFGVDHAFEESIQSVAETYIEEERVKQKYTERKKPPVRGEADKPEAEPKQENTEN